jgi:RNA 3'-terminal phosphate cyclase (ATP)
MLQLDGSIGEGGGQILRTALSLSLLTGKPFQLTHIRAGRKKPGLMRQHLVCVQAAKAIGQAKVTGDHLHSTELTFEPQTVQAGHYHFAIGSAGSTMLVLQTLLPVLMMQSQSSTLKIEGGTHNPLAPTLDFIQRGFLPAVAKIGIQVEVVASQAGFAPVGGGIVDVVIQPWTDRQILTLRERGALLAVNAHAGVLNIADGNIAERELAILANLLPLNAQEYLPLQGIGQGNTVLVEVVSAQHTEVFTALGEMGRPAEQIAKQLANQVKRYLSAADATDEHLADQLLLPLALGKGGEFSCRKISEHTRTQAAMIETFLPVSIRLTEQFLPYSALVQVIV